jgi:hypothetical protein
MHVRYPYVYCCTLADHGPSLLLAIAKRRIRVGMKGGGDTDVGASSVDDGNS